MPKIIENLPERLQSAARRQIEEAGYSAMTVRSVAKECGVGVGTVYNYYPSKEALVAAFLLVDWRQTMEAMHQASEQSSHCEPVLERMYAELKQFAKSHEKIFRDKGAVAGFSGSFGKYHGLLRSQLAAPLRKFCRDDFSAQFMAEAMLTWTMECKDFPELKDVLIRIL